MEIKSMMDDLRAKIQSKRIKLENTLIELNSEIAASFKFLQSLKNHSTEIVRGLNSVTTPEMYFKKFVDVNSFILKYLGFLTEINCKFEMLGISEKNDINSLSISDCGATSKVLLGESDNSDSQCDSKKSLSSVQNKESRNEQPEESNVMLKTVGSEKVKSTVKSSKTSSNNNSQTKGEVNSDLNANSNNGADFDINISSEVEDDLKVTPPEVQINANLNRETSNSEAPSPQKSHVVQIEKQKPVATDGLQAASLDSSNTSTCNEFQQRGIHLPNTDIPVAEVIPRKVTEFNCDSEFQKGNEPFHMMREANPKSPSESKAEVNMNEKDDIKPLSISRKVGDEFEVTIENIQSPSEFYVYIKDPQSDLLLESLQKLKFISGVKCKFKNQKNESRKAWLSEQLGSYVLYFSKYEEVWCRAKVLNWCLNYQDNFIKIFLVDYGEYKCVSVDDIGAMPEHYKKYPAFATRCHLYGIRPSEIDIDIDTCSWGKESTEKMKSLTEISEKLKIKIAPEDNFYPGMSLPVTLWLVDQNNKCVNDLLVRSKCAVHKTDSTVEQEDELSDENEILKDWNPMKADYEAYENSYELNVNDPANYIYGYVGKDYDRICSQFAKTGYCYKGITCKKEHKKLDPLGFTTDQEEVYKNAFNSLSVPPPNSRVGVQVTCLLGLNNFCCIMDDIKPVPEEENLQTLLSFMNKPDNIKEMKKLLIPPSAGQIVIARYTQDFFWYRAKILESQPEKDVYVVLYVDYGNSESVPLSAIRAIEERYLHLPFQALNCYVFGIDRNPKVVQKEAMDYLNERIRAGPVCIEIISKLPGEEVSLLVHLFDEKGKNIGEDLISNNYAVHKEEMIISSESLSMPG